MLKSIIKPKQVRNSLVPESLDNQDGSVMVLVLLVLAIMTVIGVVSSGSVVEENFMIRNVGIHKENVNLLDSALMEGLQRYMQIDDSNALNFDANGPNGAWINNIHNDPPAVGDPEEFINTIWYERNFSQRCLDAANSMDANSLPMLATRGEAANGNLRFGIVGWEPVNLGPNLGSSSLVVNSGFVWRAGRLMAEYVSADAGGDGNGFGLKRMELGVKRQW